MMDIELGRSFIPGTVTLEAYIKCIHCHRVTSCSADAARPEYMEALRARELAERMFREWGWRTVDLSETAAWLCPACVRMIERGKEAAR